MGKQQQQQGKDFERRVSTALNLLLHQRKLRMVHRFVNCVGTPADFLVAGEIEAHLIECKSLKENARNKYGYLRLSCITDNEWAGMKAWMNCSRDYWLVWQFESVIGVKTYHAIHGLPLLEAKKNGQTRISILHPQVKNIERNGDLLLDKLF